MIAHWSQKQWYKTVFCCAIFLGVLVSAPHWLHTFSDQYQGIPVHLNADEFSYLLRVQEVIENSADRFGIAITGGEELLPELQAGLIEKIYGVAFRPFVNQASTVFTIMDFLIPFLLFIVMVGFCRACHLSRKQALVAAILFSFLELYNLGRPIHQRVSFLLVLLSLWGLIEGVEKRWLWGVLGGALMGVLIGVYFWGWTAAWTWWGILLIIMLMKRSWKAGSKLLVFGAVGFVAGVPFLVAMRRLSEHPLYEEVFFRSGIGHSRVPESWSWTILFLIMVLGIITLWKRSHYISTYLVCTVITAFAVLNQHLIHGVLFLFASHYLFFLVFSAVLVLVASWENRSRWGRLTVFASVIFILGIASDNQSIISQWRFDEEDFSEQHLAAALPTLRDLDRSVILSDPLTSSFIASHTKHDVLFTHYIQHEMRSHQELAERYCLTQLPFIPNERKPEEEHVLIYGAAYDAIYDQAERERVREQELALVDRVCTIMDRDPRALLSQYGVQYLFWDEKRQPDWFIPRLSIYLREIAQGEGWSLWKVAD